MKILLIDDHSLFRDGMQLVLQKMDKDVYIVDSSSYEGAQQHITDHPDLDLVLLDLNLPGLSDTNALTAIRKDLPATPVVVLSSNDDGGKVQQILSLGAQGYIPKSTPADVLIRALKLVFSGGIYIPPEILSQQTGLQNNTDDASMPTPLTDTPLTPRQQDVLSKLVHGHSNKAIGKQLDMAESTVRIHIAAILKTLDVSNRTQAVRAALQKNWVAIEDEQ